MNLLETWNLETAHLGQTVRVYDRVDSTNTQAALLAGDPQNAGLVILAHEQTAGRGQHGRSWQGEPGLGILLSVLLFPPAELRRPVLLAAWAAHSVAETIRRCTGLQARIKWPNDVLIRGRKVCGILIEQARGTVAGVGLNVNQTAASFEQAGLPGAGSLSLFAGGSLDRDQVARQLLLQLDEEYGRLARGDLATLESCWKWRLGLLGKRVLVECHDASHRGRLRDMTFDEIQLELGRGNLLRLSPESIKHIHWFSAPAARAE